MSVAELTQKRLAEYRARKEREEVLNNYKTTFYNAYYKLVRRKPNQDSDCRDMENKDFEDEELLLPTDNKEHMLQDENVVISDTESMQSEDASNCCTYLDILYYLLWFTLWATLYAVFIKLGFGMVYLVLTALIAMYMNTRTGPKNRSEISAYSVFNKNCKSIDGTLKAEQFEREIRYGGLR